jgi:hypothetical protein
MLRWTLLLTACTLALVACGSNNDDLAGGSAGASGAADASTDADANVNDSSTPPDSGPDALPDAAVDVQDEPQPQDASSDAVETGQDAKPEAGQEAGQDAGTDRPCTLDGDECESGEKCAPVGPNEALVCRPDGDKQVGEACGESGVDDCVSGTACVPYDNTISMCLPLCSDTVPCSESYEACFDWFGPNGSVAGVCFGDDCLPPASGCESGERCTVLSAGEDAVAACVPAGPVAVGGDCSVDECEPGAMCVQEGNSYTCRAYCDSGSDCGADDQHCAWPWPPLQDIGLCTEGCDPASQTGCGTDDACYFLDPTDGSTDCFPAGTLVEGADCSSLADFCQPGLDCVREPGATPFEYYCRAFCDADHPCNSGSCTTTEATEALKFCMP